MKYTHSLLHLQGVNNPSAKIKNQNVFVFGDSFAFASIWLQAKLCYFYISSNGQIKYSFNGNGCIAFMPWVLFKALINKCEHYNKTHCCK